MPWNAVPWHITVWHVTRVRESVADVGPAAQLRQVAECQERGHAAQAHGGGRTVVGEPSMHPCHHDNR